MSLNIETKKMQQCMPRLEIRPKRYSFKNESHWKCRTILNALNFNENSLPLYLYVYNVIYKYNKICMGVYILYTYIITFKSHFSEIGNFARNLIVNKDTKC